MTCGLGIEAMTVLPDITTALKALADPVIAEHSQRFFKTGKGEYGEGDVFLGVRVPVIRQQVKKYREASSQQVRKLLRSKYHEERLFALLLLVDSYERGSEDEKSVIYDLYLANTRYINNWDLVDSSAHKIVGSYLINRDRSVLDTLSHSSDLWERRIAIIATMQFIRKDQFDDTMNIAENLLEDDEDLIQKAVGWMLREVGKRDIEAERRFLNKHYQVMPRTMLRYAIERFPGKLRQAYLQGLI